MNHHLDNFQFISSLTITGDRQSGKLTLALFFALKLTQKPITLISPFSKVFFCKKINAALQLESNLQPALENINTFNFKENWKELKNEYGYSFLLKDIEKITNSAEELIIFHRIDKFFEIHDANEIENFLFKIMTITQTAEKKIIFTANSENNNIQYIDEYFEKNIDSEFVISKRPYEAKARDVELVSSLFSTQYKTFSFELNETSKQFDLTPIDFGDQREQKIKVSRIVLASQSVELEEIVKYLFESDNFKLSQVSPTLTEMMNVIIDNPQLIIFNPSDHQSSAELKKISKMVINSNVKVLFISSRPVLRRQDKIEILQNGFCDLQEKDFHIEDFVLSIERALAHPFYNTKIQKIPKKTYVIYDKTTFDRFIGALLSKNIFFTVFKFKYQPPIAEEDIRKNLGRAFDVAFIDKSKSTIYLFLVNTLARNASAIEKKFSAINKEIQFLGYKSATKYNQDYQKKIHSK